MKNLYLCTLGLPVAAFLFLSGAVCPSHGYAATLCDSLNAGRYDIVYVCPAAWRSQVARLATHRAQLFAGSYSSIIAPAETVTACFGSGRSGIRALLHQALAGWNSPPKHVVLVGAYRATDSTVFVLPTWFIDDPAVGFWTPQVPTDDPYVFGVGSADSTPATSIGRIPVWELAGLTAYIDKVIAYETSFPAWKSNALHAVEDRDFDGNNGTLARAHADSLAPYFGPRALYNFYQSHLYGTNENLNLLNQSTVQAWNGGIGYAFFYGTTGNWHQYAFFLQNFLCESPTVVNCTSACTYDDSLRVGRGTPVVFAMTCGNGFMNMISGSPSTCGTLANYLLATPLKGAVSVTGPARALHEVPAYAITREWYRKAFGTGGPQYAEPGTVLKLVKQQLVPAMPTYRTEILQMFTLGDPAIQFWVGSDVVVDVGGPDVRSAPNVFIARPVASPAVDLAFAVDLPRPGTYAFELFDLQGRRIASRLFTTTKPVRDQLIRFETSGAGPGVYFLLGRGGGLVASSKIVLVR